MSKHGFALAGVALAGVVLAGCSGGVPKGATPQVSSQTAGSQRATAATSAAGPGRASSSSDASPASTGSSGASSATDVVPGTVRQGVASKTFAKANSIPFPVAVGNTWVYQTRIGGATGKTTSRIVAASPGSAGFVVSMSSATSVPGATSAVTSGYTFYPDGTIGYPAPTLDGVAVTGGGIRWPNAAALASGRAYHSTLQIQLGASGATEDAGVDVYGAGTETVTVPAGTYQASVVETAITAKGETIEVTTWIAQGVGTVKTVIQIHGAGAALTTTQELLSFLRASSAVGDGS
jgi:hypothetical protein